MRYDNVWDIFALIGMILSIVLLRVLLNIVAIPCKCRPHPE